MDRILGVWHKLGLLQKLVAVMLPLALAAALGGATAFVLATTARPPAVAQVVTPGASPAPTEAPLPPEPTLAPDVSPTPSPTPAPLGADPILGTDGRLTVLLLGSDYRPAHPGNRTDAIMVVSVDPTTGKAAGVSIPRDTSGFPIGDGSTYRPKVNGLYAHLQSRTGNGGAAMRKAVARAFGIEVDGYVFIGFKGVKDMVAAVGGVDITLAHAYYDAEYWVNSHKQGWGLPAGKSHLGAADALIFARSRKGDNDFGRARRQQMLVLAALDKARARGFAKMPRLLQIAAETVRTDLPLSRAADLYDVIAKTDISKVKRTVFGPKTYASGAVGTSFQLKLAVCRKWIKDNFPPVRPMGQWPPVSPPPASAGPSTAP